MIFKYIHSAAGTRANWLADITALMCGETNKNNLSAQCDIANSDFLAEGGIPSRYFVKESGGSGTDYEILKRSHKDNPAMSSWMCIRTVTDTITALNCLNSGIGGAIVNERYQSTSTSTSYQHSGTVNINAVSHVTYVGLNDTVAWISNINFVNADIHTEIQEYGHVGESRCLYVNGNFGWTVSMNNSVDMFFSSFENQQGISMGDVHTGTPAYGYAYHKVIGGNTSLPSTNNSSEYPVESPDGTLSIPLKPFEGGFTNADTEAFHARWKGDPDSISYCGVGGAAALEGQILANACGVNSGMLISQSPSISGIYNRYYITP